MPSASLRAFVVAALVVLAAPVQAIESGDHERTQGCTRHGGTSPGSSFPLRGRTPRGCIVAPPILLRRGAALPPRDRHLSPLRHSLSHLERRLRLGRTR